MRSRSKGASLSRAKASPGLSSVPTIRASPLAWAAGSSRTPGKRRIGSGRLTLLAGTKVTARPPPRAQCRFAIVRTRPNACSFVGAATATRRPSSRARSTVAATAVLFPAPAGAVRTTPRGCPRPFRRSSTAWRTVASDAWTAAASNTFPGERVLMVCYPSSLALRSAGAGGVCAGW
jgi:hypothetical protein